MEEEVDGGGLSGWKAWFGGGVEGELAENEMVLE